MQHETVNADTRSYRDALRVSTTDISKRRVTVELPAVGDHIDELEIEIVLHSREGGEALTDTTTHVIKLNRDQL